jgi:UDP-glucose 4-epimerase
MRNKKVLITGGAGYIGSHVVKTFGTAGYEIIVLDNLSTGNKDAVLFGELVIGDISDSELLEKLFTQHNFDGVLHFAGSIIAPESVEKPLKYYSNNTELSLKLIQKCLDHKVNSFIFSSTAAVYGEVIKPVSENDPTDPINPYGQSKLMVERILTDVSIANDSFNFIALRYFNVSGADIDGQIGQAFPKATNLIKVCCEVAAGKRESIEIFGADLDTPDGTAIRDYVHVMDLANAHQLAYEHIAERKQSHILNCGYGTGFSVKEVITETNRAAGKEIKYTIGPRRNGDPANVIAIAEEIKTILNWKPKYNTLNDIISTGYSWELSEVYKSWQSKT